MADPTKPTRRYDYVTDGTEIYRQSFATIRAESDLARFDDDTATVVVRMIHAAGDTSLAAHVHTHPRLVEAARTALNAGAPIFTDATMIGTGITRARLPQDNEVICTLRDPRTPGLAAAWQTTRSAAAVSLWADRLEGAVVAIGNAPTALFHLLEMMADGGPRPAAIVGVPVGFIGAAESKEALRDNPWDVPWLIVEGRRGGSALAVSALNALARRNELPT
ncbi:MAG: precorrin-8X methylmutase [Propionibacteriaceae bacterium]|nr:precorrin-8X methylmutase [Propionibacteriaceae bacterium]